MPQYQLDYVCCIFFFCQQRGGTLLAVGCGGLFVGVGNSISYTVSRITLFSISITHCCSSLSLSLSLYVYITITILLSLSSAVFSVLCLFRMCVSTEHRSQSIYIKSQQTAERAAHNKTQNTNSREKNQENDTT